MFKILVTTKLCDRVVNYAQTVSEHVRRMRDDACHCAPCHDCHELPQKVHEQLTSSSRVVHYMFTSSSRLLRDNGARVGAWVYTGLLGHCSPFQKSPAERQLISQRQHAVYNKADKMARLATTKSWPKSCECQPCILYTFSFKKTAVRIYLNITQTIKYRSNSLDSLCYTLNPVCYRTFRKRPVKPLREKQKKPLKENEFAINTSNDKGFS